MTKNQINFNVVELLEVKIKGDNEVEQKKLSLEERRIALEERRMTLMEAKIQMDLGQRAIVPVAGGGSPKVLHNMQPVQTQVHVQQMNPNSLGFDPQNLKFY